VLDGAKRGTWTQAHDDYARPYPKKSNYVNTDTYVFIGILKHPEKRTRFPSAGCIAPGLGWA
jgi:hypothetical protein